MRDTQRLLSSWSSNVVRVRVQINTAVLAFSLAVGHASKVPRVGAVDDASANTHLVYNEAPSRHRIARQLDIRG